MKLLKNKMNNMLYRMFYILDTNKITKSDLKKLIICADELELLNEKANYIFNKMSMYELQLTINRMLRSYITGPLILTKSLKETINIYIKALYNYTS